MYRFIFKKMPVIVSVRNSSCGKVMFSQACVKNSVHGGACVAKGGHVWQRGGMYGEGGMHGKGGGMAEGHV